MSNLDKFKVDQESKLKDLFGEIPLESETIVKLPSEGRFYKNKTSELTISPIKFEDEKSLTVSQKNNINPVNLILEKCVHDFEVHNLLLIDKLYLLLKIREISYGAEYPAIITCPACAAKSEIKINLSNLIVNQMPEDLEDPREISLPKLKKKVKVRFPRVSDERFLNTSEQIYNNIWRFVVELNGEKDPVFISQAIPKMPIMDIKFIISNIMRNDLGLVPKFLYDCEACGEMSEMEIPINENFFSVT